ncbi:hypothetical protein [Azospirillum sp.]|uniref:hypothetical protein n=1 Tax=Azospirillum sp. TaxID=34012 RepID=UPI002D5CF233|nr:hypothetical protein [Azospirillum sp.]HYD67627.1 hypothetical protein [Azospirillum sp.]
MRVLSLRIIAIFACFFYSFVAQADSAILKYKEGLAYRGHIELPRFTIPLPPGVWQLSAANEKRNNNNDNILSLTLAKTESGILSSWLVIDTNVDPASWGWVLPQWCSRKDVYYSVLEAYYKHEQDCRWLNHIVWEQTDSYTPSVGKNIRNFARANNIKFPRLGISEWIYLANERSFLTVNLITNPESLGFSVDSETTWASSPWHKDLVLQDPKRLAVMNTLKQHLDEYREKLKAATRL